MVRLPDLLSKDLNVVFCGMDPALSAAQVGHHFSSRSNLFSAGPSPGRLYATPDSTLKRLHNSSDRMRLYGRSGTTHCKSQRAHEQMILTKLPREPGPKAQSLSPSLSAFLGKPALQPFFDKEGMTGDKQSH